MEKSSRLMDQRQYAWDYFQLHAVQRMSLFNFFVLISAILTAGMGSALLKNGADEYIVLAAVGLMLVSFAFWKLDQRVRFFVKHAESILKMVEATQAEDGANSAELALFAQEERKTIELKRQSGWCPFGWHLSYSQCFGFVYIIFAGLGLLGFIMAILRLSGWCSGEHHGCEW